MTGTAVAAPEEGNIRAYSISPSHQNKKNTMSVELKKTHQTDWEK